MLRITTTYITHFGTAALSNHKPSLRLRSWTTDNTAGTGAQARLRVFAVGMFKPSTTATGISTTSRQSSCVQVQHEQ